MIGDKFRLEHVFANLLSNAIKFSPEGSTVLFDVVASNESEHDDLASLESKESCISSISDANMIKKSKSANKVLFKFSITDVGPGISKDELLMLFQPYYQVHC